ncbi:MAG: DUF3742 family protein [Scandinavium sp.]|uniref:DUF3742 family protein n=1 Tax=Scandinavium sp. TaxID=2830653 RepID=UPI003F36C89E
MQQNNFGYRLGKFTRHYFNVLRAQEIQHQQRGVPRWATKLPMYLCIAAIVVLAAAGAVAIAFFIVVTLLIWMYFSMTGNDWLEKSKEDEPEDGYNNTGPEGPGFYFGGSRIDNDENHH